MQYIWKVYSFKNGAKQTDLTPYVTMPIFLEQNADEKLGAGEIILERYPSAKAFDPKVKFRIERYNTTTPDTPDKTWDKVVEHDDPEEYVGLDGLYTHRISLIDPSVVAQNIHTDNFAMTYELQDVDLNYKTVVPDGTTIGNTCQRYNGGNSSPDHSDYITYDDPFGIVNYKYSGQFKNTYKYEWDEGTLNGTKGIRSIIRNVHVGNVNSVTFDIPSLHCWGSYTPGTWTRLFEMNTITRVYQIKLLNGAQIQRSTIITKYSGPTSIPNNRDLVWIGSGGNASLPRLKTWSASGSALDKPSPFDAGAIASDDFRTMYVTSPTVAHANSSYTKEVSFSTAVLSQDDIDNGYSYNYEIECVADPAYQNGMAYNVSYDYLYYFYSIPFVIGGNPPAIIDLYSLLTHCSGGVENSTASSIKINATVYAYDISQGKNTPFIAKGVKYSAYQLLRKALLTTDAFVIDNNTTGLEEYTAGDNTIPQPSVDYPIVVQDPSWNNRLKVARVNETIFEAKNLWEIFLQIGYYLHAVPYLEFAQDGTDRFDLKFRQLGKTEKKLNQGASRKITIFNSNNINEFFAQYDSYVTNLFSPQNIVEEWIVPKTGDDSFLVSNDTAELQLKYAITELVEFDIIYGGRTISALPFIFERSTYDILTNNDPTQISPAKGNSIYYDLGGTKIQGLNYVAPSENNDAAMSFKYIMQRLFGVSTGSWTSNLTFNNVKFHIKYRTQDTLRVTQVRPDLERFMKNSAKELYPHHEQFFGQQDKIIDSERFTANLWGKLVRVGNGVYQCQEYARTGEEKEAGDLVEIDERDTDGVRVKGNFYVTETETEYYNDAIFQKVTYSKNFNQIANIVTIPSEPRFYEVSERSKIRREVRIMEFFALSTQPQQNGVPRFMSNAQWGNFVKSLIFLKDRALPNFAWTRFKADKLREHPEVESLDQLFPSSEVVRTGSNTIEPVAPSDHVDCMVPLLHFPLHDGIVFEWDMDDNFQAGVYIDGGVTGPGNTADNAYVAQQPLRYVDILGRADLMRFALLTMTRTQMESLPFEQLPKAIISPPSDPIVSVKGGENMAIALDKDNREELSFNYQVNLLHKASEVGGVADDDFITFPNIFGDKEQDLKVCLLNSPQSMFDESVEMSDAVVIADNIPVTIALNSATQNIEIVFDNNNIDFVEGTSMDDVKCIVFYEQTQANGKVAYIAKNVDKLTDDHKLDGWYIYPTFN